MKLTPHYVLPFIKSAPPKALRALGLAAVMTVGACTGTAAARTAETAPPHGVRIARRYRRTKLIVHFQTLREDGFFWSEGRLNRHMYLVRSGSRR
jgi:hypothetical protein